jgi:molybdopterin-synthase adenylyltransferase
MVDDRLLIDDDDRYSQLRLIPWWDQRRLAEARVMVVGAGALGNEVLKNLALLGIGHIHIIDFDRVEASNLTRSVLFRGRDRDRPKAEVAAEAIRELNPDVHVRAVYGNVLTDIGLGLFRSMDVVIGCLDNREARLWVNRCCWKTSRPWIDGGIQEINGVVKVFTPPDGACYECAMTENDYRLINLRYSCPLLRHEDVASGKVPTAPTIASMIGGWQTQEALKLIHGMPVGQGEALVYNGVTNGLYRTRFQRREDCLSHETYAPVVELPLQAGEHTVEELFAALRALGDEAAADRRPLRVMLDRDLLVSVQCDTCGLERAVMKPLPLAGMSEGICAQCQKPGRLQLAHCVDSGTELAGHRLAELGIPPYDVVRVAGGGDERFVLLSDDRAAVWS